MGSIFAIVVLVVCCAVPAVASVKLTLKSSDGDNVYYPEEEKQLLAVIANQTQHELLASLEMSGLVDDGETLSSTLPVSLAAGQQIEMPIPIVLLEPSFTMFTVSLLDKEGEELASDKTTLSVVRPPVADMEFDDSFYGFSFFIKPETAARIGGRFIRTIMHWKFTNPRPGQVSVNEFIDLGKRCEDVGLGIIYAFSVHNRPDWLNAKDVAELTKDENLKHFQDWLTSSLERFANGPRVVEINNEPDLELGRSQKLGYFPGASLGADFLKDGYQAVKSISPETFVIGAGVSGVDFNNELRFAERLLSEADKNIDYFSPHPYADSRYLTEEGRVTWPDQYPLREMLAQAVSLAREYTQGQAVWSTELGWAIPEDVLELNGMTRDWAAIAAQQLVIFKTVPGVEKLAFFAGQLDWMERGMNYSMFRRESRQVLNWHPLPTVNAFATVSSLLEGSGNGDPLKLGPAVVAYQFENSKTGKSIVATWARKHEIFQLGHLPDGTRVIDVFGRERDAMKEDAIVLDRSPKFLTISNDKRGDLLSALSASVWRPKQLVSIEKVSAPDSGEVVCHLENLWHEPVDVTVTLGEDSKELTLQPGLNTVGFPVQWANVRDGVLRLPITVDSADESITAEFLRPLLNAKYIESSRISIDGRITMSERDLLTEVLDERQFVLPPDPAIPWDGPDDLSVAYGYAWNEEGLFFLAEVQDDVVVKLPEVKEAFWDVDSLQIALVPGAEGALTYGPGDRELGLVLTENGDSRFYQTHPIKGDLLEFPAAVGHEGDKTIYELFVPWDYIYGGHSPEQGAVIATNFILNDNDGNGRAYWLGPADGIASGKRTEYFPWLVLGSSN